MPDIRIAGATDEPEALAAFFCANVTPEYISHSELQSTRAVAPGRWAADLESQIVAELKDALAQPAEARNDAPVWNGVFVAQEAGRTVGLAIVLYSREAPVPFGVLEDLVVDAGSRGRGIGTALIEAIIQDMQRSGLGRAFLESGGDNHGAHGMFEARGFKTGSIVMSRDL